MEQLEELCRKTGYIPVATGLGIVKVVASGMAAPYIEGNLVDVIRRLIRLSRSTTH